MKLKNFSPITLAVALMCATSGAHALLLNATVTGGTTLLSATHRSISDSTVNSFSVSTSQTINTSISQFNSSNGVLVGVIATLTAGDSSTFLRADGASAARGSATVSANWTGLGGLSATGTLNTVSKTASADGTDNSWNPLTQTITTPTDLNGWVGSGNLNTGVSTTLVANKTSPNNTTLFTAGIGSSGTTDVTTLKDLGASYSVAYDYRDHAIASFDGSSTATFLDIDFGSVILGSSVSPIDFSIFNLASINGVNLDLDVVGIIDNIVDSSSVLTTSLIGFTDLLHGDHNDFSASFNPISAGDFDVTYVLTLSDQNTGASSSWNTYNLALHLSGSAVQAVNIPEPTTLALLGLGLAGFAATRRRKQ